MYVGFGPEPAVFARNRERGVAVLNQQLLPGYAFFRRARRATGIRWCEMTIGGDEAAHFLAEHLILGAVTQVHCTASFPAGRKKIGRASCRERGCQYV